MPIYEYECRKCRRRFSHLARTVSEPPPRCPDCGEARPLKKPAAFNAASAPASSTGAGGPCSTGCCSL